MKKVLFISHDASISGAPILLLNLLEALKESEFKCDRIIIKNAYGSLSHEFEKYGEVLFFNSRIKPRQSLKDRFFRRIGIKQHTKNNNAAIQQWISEADIIFSNTITNGDILSGFEFRKDQVVVSYIHELQMASEFYTNPSDITVLLHKTTVFAIPSNAVRHFVSEKFNIAEGRLHQLNYYIPSLTKVSKHSVHNGFIVGMIGTLEWRKGAELLPVIMVDFFTKHPDSNVKFYWKGADINSIDAQRIIYELVKCGLEDKLSFMPSSRDTSSFYNSIDILLMCSKEDPYPLVVLEAAEYKKPCICFENAGGAPEFVQEDAGTIVPYLNIQFLTDAIFGYYKNRNQGIEKGQKAYERYCSLHSDKKVIVEQFKKLLA